MGCLVDVGTFGCRWMDGVNDERHCVGMPRRLGKSAGPLGWECIGARFSAHCCLLLCCRSCLEFGNGLPMVMLCAGDVVLVVEAWSC
jgi:hypothetical protein